MLVTEAVQVVKSTTDVQIAACANNIHCTPQQQLLLACSSFFSLALRKISILAKSRYQRLADPFRQQQQQGLEACFGIYMKLSDCCRFWQQEEMSITAACAVCVCVSLLQ